MASYRYKFLGKAQLPRMSEAEASDCCRLSDEQIAAIPSASRFDENGKPKIGRPAVDLTLGYGLQLVHLALTGRLASVTDSFPPNVVKVVASQLEVDAAAIASIKSIYRGKVGPKPEASIERRLREQRTWARETLGCPGRCKSEPPYRPNSEPGMEAAGAGLRAVDEFSLRV